MTFVVARTFAGGIRLVGDMRVTSVTGRGYPIAVLKVVPIDPDLVVAYAGNLEHAMDVVRAFAAGGGGGADAEQLIEQLEASCARDPGTVEYLVARRPKELWQIDHIEVRPNLAAAMIGNRNAFEIYQRGVHDAQPPQVFAMEGYTPPPMTPERERDLLLGSQMAAGIFALDQSGIEDVGEAFVSVWGGLEGFRYEQQAVLTADHEQVITDDDWTPADWGTVAEGGFGYSVLAPSEPGVGMVALYFPHAGLGMLYAPLKQDEPCVYPRVTQAELYDCLMTDTGVMFAGASFGGE
jgi:hypothetical protein